MTHNLLKNNSAEIKLICKIKPRGVHTCESDSTMIFTAILLCNVLNSQEVFHLLKVFFHLQDPKDCSHPM